MAQAVLPGTTQTLPVDAAKLRSDMAIRRTGRIIRRVTPFVGFGFLWIPIIILVVFSFNNSRTNAVWQGFTLDWYRSLIGIGDFVSQDGVRTEARFSPEQLLGAVNNSVVVAVASTILSTFLGTCIAIGLERYKFRGRRLVDLLIYLPVVIPEITMGLSLQLFFSTVFRNINEISDGRLTPTLSLVTVVIGHVVFCMPFVTITVRARLAGMSKSLEEAARDLGANEWQVMRRVTLPLLMPGIVAGALLALTLSLDDYVVTLFVNGPGGTTLPIYVGALIKFAVNPSINALSTIIVLVSMSLVLVSLVLQRNRD
jgi:spermidine/putrescine transport system permease protein